MTTTLKTIRSLIEAGLDDDQIKSVIGDKQASGSAQQGGNAGSGKEGDPGSGDNMKAVLDAINSLTATIQASNLAGAKNQEPETVDDMLESLIIED